MKQNRVRSNIGFTLVEVLVVIGVIGLIIGLVVPALKSARAESQSTICLTNLRQLFTAVETARQQTNDMLPYAAPLPVPVGQQGIVEGLPKRLSAIMKPESETWRCPADLSQESEDLGTSYVYVAGAFMILEPPLLDRNQMPAMNEQANRERVARVITHRYTNEYLRFVPILVDSGDYHNIGNREPRNAVFIDGNARVMKPTDGDVQPPRP